MKIYILYLLSSFLIFWFILFNFGISAGFANYIPISALIGSIILFIGACPALIFNKKLGLILGLIGCLMLVPYSIVLIRGIIEDGVFNMGLLIGIPSILVLLSTYFSIKYLFNNQKNTEIELNKLNKLLLTGVPIALFIIYFFLYGKYWNWNMFKI
jgi:hypothetical protein